MWTRTYFLLLLVRLYFALSPSYIHPDENFQGPEIIAGHVFSYPYHQTWEFTSDKPVRSVLPLWMIYGLPMLVAKRTIMVFGSYKICPKFVYYSLRLVMFMLSSVLGDWAVHELVPSPRQRDLAVTLVASSYATWTYQTHTFSNSIETIVVLWSLVMVQRIRNSRHRRSLGSSALLGSLLIFGLFNRITFPTFVFAPMMFLVPHFVKRPVSVLIFSIAAIITTIIAVITDTYFYKPASSLSALVRQPIITPLNSLLYNSQTSNLSDHGLHPHYQHLLSSLPQLLGPALVLIPTVEVKTSGLLIISAFSSIVLLSTIPHQEPRFLLPIVPLILASIRLPRPSIQAHLWVVSWIVFNSLLGIILGIFHQGGIVPMQLHIGQPKGWNANVSEVIWWRTYSPPVWLLNQNAMQTTDLMGVPFSLLSDRVSTALGSDCAQGKRLGLVAPYSSLQLETWRNNVSSVHITELWSYPNHINFDDMNPGEEGVWETIRRIVGRRGLKFWSVGRACE